MPVTIMPWPNLYTTNNTIQFAATNATTINLYLNGNVVNPGYVWTTTTATAITGSFQMLAPTAEQIRLAAIAEKARVKAKRIADHAAENLLRELIGTKDFRMWKDKGTLFISSKKHAGLGYQIKAGEMIRLFEKKDANGIWQPRKDRLCIHPAVTHPAGDEVATLAALAMWDEDRLWKVANHHYPEPLPMPVAA